jgi:aryl-alcohol dehydrogenase-like predicted oxidoreductase
MQEVADAHDCSVARVALAYVMNKPGVTSVIIGAKREDQLRDNIAATEVTLSDDQMKKLDEVSALPKEYPGWMIEMQSSNRRGQVSD